MRQTLLLRLALIKMVMQPRSIVLMALKYHGQVMETLIQ